MIDITDQVVAVCRETVGRAFRTWPQTAPPIPYAIVDKVGHSVELTDRDGTEIRVRLTYTIGIMASKPSEAQSISERVGDALALYNFHTTGFTGTYEEPNHFYRTNITVSGAVDRRGNSFN